MYLEGDILSKLLVLQESHHKIRTKTSIDSLQSRAEVLVEVGFGIYDLSKDETYPAIKLNLAIETSCK